MLNNFHFLRPWWFVAVIPTIILFILYRRKMTSNSNTWQEYCDPHLLPFILVNSENQRNSSWLPSLLLTIWLICITALAGPTWEQYAQSVYQKNIARIIALDVSSSMNASDIVPSRLERAKYKILDLLKATDEGQTGMIVFSSSPFVVSPLTNDNNTIAAMIPVLDSNIVPVQGVNIAKALQKSASLLQQTGITRGEIILITDSTPTSEDYQVAKQIATNGYHISVLGIGTQKGGPVSAANGGFATDNSGNVIFSKLDQQALQKLATQGDGSYINFSNDDSDVEQLAKITNSNTLGADANAQEETKKLWRDEGHWLIWLAMILVACITRKGWLDKLC